MRIDESLASVVEDLAYAFDGVFSQETVARAVSDARALLEPRATVQEFLPVLVARQAREQLVAAAQGEGRLAKPVPELLFVCVHNAGRSQMAAGYLQHLAGDRIDVLSAGSEPKDQINPVAIEVMAEEGIDIAGNTPKILTVDAVRESDVVITMGCGDACPIFPGKRYEDWQLDDPAGQGSDSVRRIRDDIRDRVETLIGELTAE